MTPTAFFELFLSLSTQAAIIIGATAWIATRRKLEGEAHRVWAACHFLILVLVVLAVLVPHLRLFPSRSIASYSELAKTAPLGRSIGTFLFFLWIAGTTVSSLALLLGMLQVARILRSSQPFLSDDHASSQSGSTISSEDQKQNEKLIQLLTSPKTNKAFCWQFHQPCIVLPGSMQTFPADELQGVIRHEKAHLEAGHPLHLFLQRIVEILFWYHPLVWWASRQAAWSREFHCDNYAVATAREAVSYLRGLLRITEQREVAELRLPAGLNFASGKSLVRRRANRIATRDWNVVPDRRLFAFSFVPLFVSFIISLGIWFPVDAATSYRSIWSPWPEWSATALHEFGATVRDYEIDSHRLRHHEHHEHH